MTALIFVHTNTSFKNEGIFPIRRFDPEREIPWTSTTDALGKGASGYLEPGIYGIISDDNLVPDLHAMNGEKLAEAYDVIILKGKDPWVQAVPDAEMLARVRKLIPIERDGKLDQFMIARGG